MAADTSPRSPVAKPYSRRFYERAPEAVAPALLGAVLVCDGCAGRIVETEAYLAVGDPAAHAYKGRTPRTEVLFGVAGRAYVYRTRQHHCLNVAVQKEGVPGCVLIRALQPVAGIEAMRRRRGGVEDARLTNGPGNLCAALGIDMSHYGVDLTAQAEQPQSAAASLTILRGSKRGERMVVGRRVGVAAAVDWPLRYRLLPA